MTDSPRVRVAVLNFNGAHLLPRCLEHLERLDYPAHRLELVVVDNASTDRSVELVRQRFPQVKILAADHNLGFAEGNNLALRELEDFDYVALLNNDAFVEPGWLRPLVDALAADPGLGAACPKIVWLPRFVEVELEAPSFTPGGGDDRALGVRLSGVRVGGEQRWKDAQLVEGWYALERGHPREGPFRWSMPRARVRVPLPADGRRDAPAELRLAAERPTPVVIRSGAEECRYEVGREPGWVKVPLAGEPVDVIQNVGNDLIECGYAGDRGFMEIDRGQYDEPAEVFGWCGGSVLLRSDYLQEVGLFDTRFFIYYEDVDLSWRGRAQGWRYLYVPDSVVRHIHSATNVEGSAFFEHLVERNRLIVHAKNAPPRYAARATALYVRRMIGHLRHEVVHPAVHRQRPDLTRFLRRARSFGSFLVQLAPVLRERRRLRRRQSVSDEQLMAWVARR